MRRLVLAFSVAFAACAAFADNADTVLAQILGNVAKLKAADPQAVPMAFWDFDGTIIKGDVSEGLTENGCVMFKGLVQRTIEEGLSTTYPKDGGWAQYIEKDYPRLCQVGYWLGWPFNAQIYDGVEGAKLDAFCRREYAAVYSKWYFAFSVKVLDALSKAGVENYIVSASPECFVRNAAETVGVPRERIRGIRIVEQGGRLTTQLAYPMPFAEGKIENVREFVLARPHGVAVAGFGNSYGNDAPFIRYIATQPSLPGGAKGTGVMINGGKPRAGYAEHFIKVDEDAVVGAVRDDAPVLKVAVMSDIQGYAYPEDAGMRNLERALDVFARLKPDVVVNDGDINDNGWDMSGVRYYKARCDARLGKIPHVACAGNHEIGFIPRHLQAERTSAACIADFNAAFGEGASPLVHKTISGYDFIALALSTDAGYTEADMALLKEALDRAVQRDAAKPIFVLTHYHPAETVNDSSAADGRGGLLRKLLNAYPQVVNLSGHTHNPLQDPRSIWQGEFTVVDTSTLCYGCLEGNPPMANQISCLIPYGHEAVGFMLMEVYRDRLVFRRFTARDRRELPGEWSFALPYDPKHPKFDFASRKAATPAPELPVDAEPTLWYDYGFVYLMFNAATDPSSVYRYRIELTEKGGETQSHYQLSDYYRIPEHRQNRVVFRIPPKGVRKGGSYRCRIFPVGFFGSEGRPCEWEFTIRSNYSPSEQRQNCMQE